MRKIHDDEQTKIRELYENEVEELKQIGLKRIDESFCKLKEIE